MTRPTNSAIVTGRRSIAHRVGVRVPCRRRSQSEEGRRPAPRRPRSARGAAGCRGRRRTTGRPAAKSTTPPAHSAVPNTYGRSARGRPAGGPGSGPGRPRAPARRRRSRRRTPARGARDQRDQRRRDPLAGAIGGIRDADGRRARDARVRRSPPSRARPASPSRPTRCRRTARAVNSSPAVPERGAAQDRAHERDRQAADDDRPGARVVSPTAPPTSSSTAVSTETRRTSPSISGRARMAACVVVAMGAMTLGSMPAANSAAMPASSALAARAIGDEIREERRERRAGHRRRC